MSNKHAYLIMVHNEFYLLEQLLHVLDDERNDIYIHIDKKCGKVDLSDIKKSVNKSHVYLVKRMKVAWGGDSMMKCEYNLLKAAYPKHYQYYHLLSGVDFPLKSQDYIHDFFDKSNGLSYIRVTREGDASYDTKTKRNTEYHLLQNVIGRNGISSNFFFRMERRLIKLQRRFGINRLDKCTKEMYKGSQWFSITDDMVKEILAEEKFAKKYFLKSFCPDELFINTIIMNSGSKKIDSDNYLRLIDWKRGQPYVFQLQDYDELINCKKLFARKFTCETEDGRKLIVKLKNYIMQE